MKTDASVGAERNTARIDRLEGLYNTTIRSLERNSQLVGNLKDDIVNSEKKHYETIDGLVRKFDKFKNDTHDSMIALSQKLDRTVSRAIDSVTAIDMQINAIRKKEEEIKASALQKADDVLSKSVERVLSLESIISELKEQVKSDLKAHRDIVDNQIDVLTIELYADRKTLSKEVNYKLDDIDKRQKKNNKYTIAALNLIRNDIRDLKSLEKRVDSANKKSRDAMFAAVNERLNRFMDDVNKKYHIKESACVDGEVLKRLAYLEGVKDSVESRRGTEEIMNELEEATLSMYKLEAQGKTSRDLKVKIDTLNWLLGGQNG